jgi:hypothetical protein
MTAYYSIQSSIPTMHRSWKLNHALDELATSPASDGNEQNVLPKRDSIPCIDDQGLKIG